MEGKTSRRKSRSGLCGEGARGEGAGSGQEHLEHLETHLLDLGNQLEWRHHLLAGSFIHSFTHLGGQVAHGCVDT